MKRETLKESERILCFLLAILLCVGLLYCFSRPQVADTVGELSSPPRIVIDAGHGGIDGGTVGVSGVLERDLNLAIARKCELLLTLFGVEVVMTRHDAESLDDGTGATIAQRKAADIKMRVAIANAGADALISVHMNSFPDPQYWGTQVFYSMNDPASATLAESLQTAARKMLAPENARESKAADDRIYLLRHTTIPAVIVECGFLSNPAEEAKLCDNSYQNAVAAAICVGTLDFLRCTA